MTNFERIKAMSIEELAELLLEYDFDCWRVIGVVRAYPEYQKSEAIKAQIEWFYQNKTNL